MLVYKAPEGPIGAPAPKGQPMSGLPVGALVKFQVGGVDKQHILVQHNKPSAMYDDSFNNSVTLLMKDVYENRQWHSSNVNDYANSTIHAHLNGAYLNLIEEKVRNVIKQVKIPYRPGSGTSATVNSGANGLPTKVYLLGGYEVGYTTASNQYFPIDGSALSYFISATDSKRIAYLSGVQSRWWLRSAYTVAPNDSVWGVYTLGYAAQYTASNLYGIRPAIVLPNDVLVSLTPDTDGAYTIVSVPTHQLLSNMPVGALIKTPVTTDIWAGASRFGSNILWKIAAQNHVGYPTDSVTLITNKIIQLMCPDAAEPTNTNANRKTSGNNRAIHSNVLQWLNSNALAGAWYTAQHTYDAPPTNANVYLNYNEYDTWAGFLSIFHKNFVSAILDTPLISAKASVDGGGSETAISKMFLASTTEVGLGTEGGISEGAKLPLFSDNTSRIAYPSTECVNNSEYTNANLKTTLGWFWWTRTPVVTSASDVRSVGSNGAIDSGGASAGIWGIRPLCNLSANTKISLQPDIDGAYTIVEVTA